MGAICVGPGVRNGTAVPPGVTVLIGSVIISGIAELSGTVVPIGAAVPENDAVAPGPEVLVGAWFFDKMDLKSTVKEFSVAGWEVVLEVIGLLAGYWLPVAVTLLLRVFVQFCTVPLGILCPELFWTPYFGDPG